jgi:hypothetical protein
MMERLTLFHLLVLVSTISRGKREEIHSFCSKRFIILFILLRSTYLLTAVPVLASKVLVARTVILLAQGTL